MFVFFFNDTATTEIYTLSLHDALPISPTASWPRRRGGSVSAAPPCGGGCGLTAFGRTGAARTGRRRARNGLYPPLHQTAGVVVSGRLASRSGHRPARPAPPAVHHRRIRPLVRRGF